MHVRARSLLDLDDMRAIATGSARTSACAPAITTIGDCSFAGAAAEAAAETGLRAIVYLEVFGRDALRARPVRGAARARRARALRPRAARRLASRARTRARSSSTRPARRSGSPGDASRGERRRARLARRRHGRLERRWPSCSCRPPGETGIRLLADAGLLGPHADGGPLRARRRRGDRAARRAPASGSRTARARTAISAAASRRCRAPRRRRRGRRSRPTAPPRRRRSTSSRRSARRSWPRAPVRGGPTP